jgi:hypothetical protein
LSMAPPNVPGFAALVLDAMITGSVLADMRP